MTKHKKQDSKKTIKKTLRPAKSIGIIPKGYDGMLSNMMELVAVARLSSVRAVNSIMTATYWEIGRRIVEFEQAGKRRAEYGEELLKCLSNDLTTRFGRGFSRFNLGRFRTFYLTFSLEQIRATPSLKFPKADTDQILFGKASHLILADLAKAFPLPWSHYVLLMSSSRRSPEALAFYHAEALRGGWSIRQLRRQIGSQFYERTALSRNKMKMLKEGSIARPDDTVTAEEEIKDPLVLEFLDLKDEYSEMELEEALVHHLEHFLLELGNDFAFVARQKRLRVGDEWYRVDLLFFHRILRCLVVIDLKLDRFTPADAGQMHFYLNYAREHWTQPDENPPVGMVLCAEKKRALVHYATDSLPNTVLIREYLTALPSEKSLADKIHGLREKLERRL